MPHYTESPFRFPADCGDQIRVMNDYGNLLYIRKADVVRAQADEIAEAENLGMCTLILKNAAHLVFGTPEAINRIAQSTARG